MQLNSWFDEVELEVHFEEERSYRYNSRFAAVYMLCAKYKLGQSVDCPAQSMDPQIVQ